MTGRWALGGLLIALVVASRQPLASGFFYQRLSERLEERETTRPMACSARPPGPALSSNAVDDVRAFLTLPRRSSRPSPRSPGARCCSRSPSTSCAC